MIGWWLSWNVSAIIFACAVLTAQTHAQEPNRYALIIANEAYSDKVGRLHNPHKDAKLIRQSLVAVGFPQRNIEIVRDASRGQILGAVERHARRLSKGGSDAIGFLYYSGHGTAKPNTDQNYLIPVTVSDALSDELWYDAVSLDRVRDILQDHAPQAAHIVVFDACRNELQSGQRGGKGFVPMLDWGGMLIAYSTAPGKTASDGERNATAGPYATVLAEELREARGISASELFARVRFKMRAKAQGQSPWFLHGLDRQVRFGASDTAQFGPLEQRPPLSEAAIAWERLKDSGDIPTLEAFRKQYGSANPLYDRFAEQRIRELNEQQDVAVGIVDLPAPVPIEAKCEYIKIRLGTAQTACIEPGSGKSFRDCANCPEMVVVPVASFVMGSSKESESRGDDEGPQHQVTISKPFAVGKFEVTRAQFETFVRETGYPSGNRCWTNENGKFAERSERSYRNPGFSQADSHPVVCVNKEDAMSYVKWLNSKITGTTYRLLSEAEWEFVARATTKTPYFFGDDQSELCANGNGLDETAKKTFRNLPMAPCSDGYVFTSPVGSFSANRFGLHDVHGNAWEWAADCWHETYAGAPNDGSAWMGADGGECTKHVLRGGSWDNDPRDLRSAVRNWLNAGSRYNSFGFRVARSLSP